MTGKLLSILILFSIQFANAQSVICGYNLAMEKISRNKEYADDVRQTFEQAKNDIVEDRFEEVFTIPVAVHIVWKDSIENIDDSLVLQQIDVLNENYRRLNSNAINVRDIFSDIVGDPKIEFSLTEIIRVHTDTVFEIITELPDLVKLSEMGGSDAVDVKKNLNIWVCNIQPLEYNGQVLGRLLGYSYPPTGLSHWPSEALAPSEELEGVVLDYKTIGRNNPYILNIPGFSNNLPRQGITGVHEIGHYLGLRHIWGDGNAFLGDDGCKLDDGVDDTPNCATQSNFDCNFAKNTCTDTSSGTDLPDMIENFMDYSSESCMNSFTNGQIQIMRSVLRNVRCELVGDCEQVATNDVLNSDWISTTPNPAQDYVNLVINSKKRINLNIYNSIGKSLMKMDVINSKRINTSGFDKGLYFFEIRDGQSVIVKKVIIQ